MHGANFLTKRGMQKSKVPFSEHLGWTISHSAADLVILNKQQYFNDMWPLLIPDVYP